MLPTLVFQCLRVLENELVSMYCHQAASSHFKKARIVKSLRLFRLSHAEWGLQRTAPGHLLLFIIILPLVFR